MKRMAKLPSFNDAGIAEAEQGLTSPPMSPPATSTSFTNLTDVELDASHDQMGGAEIGLHVSDGGGGSLVQQRKSLSEVREEDEKDTVAEEASNFMLPGGIRADESQPLGRLIKKAFWASHKCIDGMEFVGGVVASMLGITDSRYQWVLDTLTDDDIVAAKEDFIASRREKVMLFEEIEQRKQEAAAAAGNDAGQEQIIRGTDAVVSDIEAN